MTREPVMIRRRKVEMVMLHVLGMALNGGCDPKKCCVESFSVRRQVCLP